MVLLFFWNFIKGLICWSDFFFKFGDSLKLFYHLRQPVAKAICDEHLKEFAQATWYDDDDNDDDLLINFQGILITSITPPPRFRRKERATFFHLLLSLVLTCSWKTWANKEITQSFKFVTSVSEVSKLERSYLKIYYDRDQKIYNNNE